MKELHLQCFMDKNKNKKWQGYTQQLRMKLKLELNQRQETHVNTVRTHLLFHLETIHA